MPNPVAEAAVEALEIDAFAKDIQDLVPQFDCLYSFFKKEANTVPISNVTAAGGTSRAAFRVNMRIQGGAPITQGTGNADSLGRGTGSQWVGMALSPVIFYSVCEITYLARRATQGPKRSEGGFNVQAQELKNSLTQAMTGLESLLQGDGSGTLDSIPSTATINNNTGSGQSTSSIVGLNVAAQFTDQQVVQVFSAIGGTNRGSFTISYVDPVLNTIYSAGALPPGTATGDLLIVNGGTGATGSSLMGLRAYQTNSTTGTLNGVARSSFPSRLSTPNINLNGTAVTPNIGHRAVTLLGRSLGPDNEAIQRAVWYTGPDQAMAITNLYYNVLIANAQDVKGDKPLDMGKKFFTDTFAGRKLHVSWNALPGRLDLICPDTWYLGELIPLELYDFGGGNTVVPVVDINTGSYLTSNMFAYNCGFNLANSNVRAGVYISNAAVPSV